MPDGSDDGPHDPASVHDEGKHRAMNHTGARADRLPPGEEFDPATASLADALRKSFRVLKVMMFVLVVLYLASGLFSVKSDERGIRYRFGEIVGRGTPYEVLDSGWKWSWPFPIERWETISIKERELPVEFMLQLSDDEKATGKITLKLRPLSPERDDYLVTGDANILHAKLIIKYQITDVVDYVTNVYPMPNPRATVHSKASDHYPEYTLMRNLARDAMIETAARQAALDIRGSRQDVFMLSVARSLNRRLRALANRGTPLGISVDENTGVIAPKMAGQLEAIMPPRQTQEVFDQVFAAETGKSGAIIKAKSYAEALLVNTAGPNHEQIAAAIDAEYDLLRKISQLENASKTEDDDKELASLRETLSNRRGEVESLLMNATGAIRATIRNAESRRDEIVKEATGDYNQFMAVREESLQNPEIFYSRLLNETRARVLAGEDVTKVLVPRDSKEIRLTIKREGKSATQEEDKKDNSFDLTPPEIVKPVVH